MKRFVRTARPLRRQQRGIATLVVVMVLFFIVSLVAAYTSRNLIFEQRTSANQYRSTQALEVAEAGLEWGLAMLNGGLVTADCLPSVNGADKSFRDRYLVIDSKGYISGRLGTSGGYIYPTCVLDGTAWTCRCPADGSPTIPAPTTAGAHPAFRLFFHLVGSASATQSSQPGMVQIHVNACTQLDDECLKFNPGAAGGPGVATGVTNESLANVFAVAALTGTAASPPVATLTARGDITLPGTAVKIYNGDASTGGIAVHAGGNTVTIGGIAGSAPGAPAGPEATFFPDQSISSSTLDLDPAPPLVRPSMFANVFNMRGDVFRDQPATLRIDCTASCTAATVRAQIALNPGRPIWIEGNFSVDSAGAAIGTAGQPVLMVVNGDLDFGTFGSIINGLVYVKGSNWSGTSARLNGAIVAEDSVIGSASTTPTLVYDQAILDGVRQRVGSFVRVPGSWKDFK